jgi:hypothetical protein
MITEEVVIQELTPEAESTDTQEPSPLSGC